MAKRCKKQEKKNEYCCNCGHGVWYYDSHNLDNYNKLPICCRCKFSTRAMIRSEHGCEHWKPKNPNELSNIE